jgi:hypothetical protein
LKENEKFLLIVNHSGTLSAFENIKSKIDVLYPTNQEWAQTSKSGIRFLIKFGNFIDKIVFLNICPKFQCLYISLTYSLIRYLTSVVSVSPLLFFVPSTLEQKVICFSVGFISNQLLLVLTHKYFCHILLKKRKTIYPQERTWRHLLPDFDECRFCFSIFHCVILYSILSIYLTSNNFDAAGNVILCIVFAFFEIIDIGTSYVLISFLRGFIDINYW